MRAWMVLLLIGCRTGEGDKPPPPKLDESKMPGATDVRAFAKDAGVELKQLRCASIGDSKAFTCRTSLSEAEAKKLAGAWGLEPDDPTNSALMRGRKFGCEGYAEYKDGWTAWASRDKPEKLAGVSYARLYFKADTNSVCVEMDKIASP